MGINSGSADERRQFTSSYFFGQFKEGWLIIIGECRAYWSEWRAKDGALKAPLDTNHEAFVTQPGRTTWDWDGRKDKFEHGQQRPLNGTLVYGLGCLSKLFQALLLCIPGFVFDTRPGLLPSRGFILASYTLCINGIITGFFLIKFALEPALIDLMRGLSKNIIRILAFGATTCQVVFTIYGLGSLLMIAHNCRFIREFVLYHCNIISLPKSYQRRKALELFLSHFLLGASSKSIPITLRLIYDSKHPRQLIHWSSGTFALARAASIALVSVGSIIISTSAMVLPYISSFLIACSAEHLNSLLHKEMARFEGFPNNLSESSRRSQRIDELLDERTRRIIADYSCDTLTQDWPDLIIEDDCEECENPLVCEQENESRLSNISSQSNELRESQILEIEAPKIFPQFVRHLASWFVVQREKSAAPFESGISCEMPSVRSVDGDVLSRQSSSKKADSRLNPSTEIDRSIAQTRHYTLAASSLLFLYKNLIKSMSELKGMILIYERKFAIFHLIQICIDSLIVAQWINTSLNEMRLHEEIKIAPNDNRRPDNKSGLVITLVNDSMITPLTIESTVGVLSYITLNTYIFMRSDCLPDNMVKMRSRLFKININLAKSALRLHEHQQDRARRNQSHRSIPEVTVGTESAYLSSHQRMCGRKSLQSNSVELKLADESTELDHVWSLYDQIDRLGELVNFRLTTGTYYSKRCLLWIFGNTVSLTLLYIQIVDIYSHT